MYKFIFSFFTFYFMLNCNAQNLYTNYPIYKGTDLGLTYSKQQSIFKVWSPTAEEVKLMLYKNGEKGDAYNIISLTKLQNGVWQCVIKNDLNGVFYTFSAKINNAWKDAVPDPYAKAVGVNGKRAMVLDLASTNPPNWAMDKSPSFSKKNVATDAVIYELHIRDASISPSSGIKNKGKYLGLSELNSHNIDGLTTGLSHLKELGVTHIHLLPFFDYNSVDETKLNTPQYNWGYDPLNYNTPEGSYSTNPYDGVTRIQELKIMIAAMHQNGLNVIFDAVYNHTGVTEKSNFNQLAPGYYYRHNADGSYSNATACGNEMASEMPMMQKFMVESLSYWVKEYHIDGFRFDLMGVHDIETMNLISKTLHKLKPNIILYGEGWTAGASILSESKRAVKKNVNQLKNIAVFSDDIRDGIKGSVFNINDKGFATGNIKNVESIKFGVVASCKHPQIDYEKVNYSKAPYADEPNQVITYADCHDNNILWDKIALSFPEASEMDRKQMQKLSLAIVLTSQGIPFLHAGSEFLRSKNGVENSYNAGDSINQIDWNLKTKNIDVNNFVKSLIAMRKAHPAFRMTSSKDITKNIYFEKSNEGTLVYTLNGQNVGDTWKKIIVTFNVNNKATWVDLPSGKWNKTMDTGMLFDVANNNRILLEKYSMAILYMQ